MRMYYGIFEPIKNSIENLSGIKNILLDKKIKNSIFKSV
jgi:hypothetical protein